MEHGIACYASVVYQYVYFAKIIVNLLKSARDRFSVRHVACVGFCVWAYFLRRNLRGFSAYIDESANRTLIMEPLGAGKANALGRSGDYGCFAFEPF
jgi:hypothetical protein